MAKEWILNNAMNRWQLNYKRNVGPTSKSIRECQPSTMEEWKEYYYHNVRSKEHINSLGEKLFKKIKTVVAEEVEKITEEDCIRYMREIVIKRTYEGYVREKEIIKGKLEKSLGVEIKEAPDKWDRRYGVDFYIEVDDKYIGLQIKPQNRGYDSQIWAKEYELIKESNKKFTQKHKGRVFFVYSVKKEGKKTIQNSEVIEKIKKEISRLKS